MCLFSGILLVFAVAAALSLTSHFSAAMKTLFDTDGIIGPTMLLLTACFAAYGAKTNG